MTATGLLAARGARASARSPEPLPEAGETARSLYAGLVASVAWVLEAGGVIPCTGPDSADWTSDDPAAVQRARLGCLGCPLAAGCLAYAEEARAFGGVWGGEVVRPTPGEKRRSRWRDWHERCRR